MMVKTCADTQSISSFINNVTDLISIFSGGEEERLRGYPYLTGRVQQTMCVNALSPPAKISMGVPQGSILGPLLFLVYINGIQSELQHSKITMFADDMAFYCHENSPTNLESKLNADLAAITSWLHDNKLTLNVTKSKFMVIGRRNKLSQFYNIALVANNDQLENVTKFKYRRVIINQHLTWRMTTLNNYKVK